VLASIWAFTYPDASGILFSYAQAPGLISQNKRGTSGPSRNVTKSWARLLIETIDDDDDDDDDDDNDDDDDDDDDDDRTCMYADESKALLFYWVSKIFEHYVDVIGLSVIHT